MEELHKTESNYYREQTYASMYLETATKILASCYRSEGCNHRKGCCFNIAMCNTIFLLAVLLGELVFDDKLIPTISGIRLLFNDLFNDLFNNTSLSDYTSVSDLPKSQIDNSRAHSRRIYATEVITKYSTTSSHHQRQKGASRHAQNLASTADAVRIRSHLLSFGRPKSRDAYSHSLLQFSGLFKSSISLFSGADVEGNFGSRVQAIAKHRIYCHLHALREISEKYEDSTGIHVGCGYIQYRNKRYDSIYDQDQDKIGGAPNLAVKYATLPFPSRTESNSYADENKTLRYWHEVKVGG